jgi:hypothetical protein
LREDGKIVDLNGIDDVSFKGVSTGNYFLVIRHRNHLGIRSATARALNGALGSATPSLYDFTASQSQAFQNTSTPPIPAQQAMKDLGGGVFGMWGGNANAILSATSNSVVRANGGLAINDYLYLVNTVLGANFNTVLGTPASPVYNSADVNLDGIVRANGGQAINDYVILVNVMLNGNFNLVYTQHL